MNLGDSAQATYATVDTAIGIVYAAVTEYGVRCVHPSPTDETFEAFYAARYGFRPCRVDEHAERIERAIRDGDPTDVVIDWRGTSLFTQAVLEQTGRVPAGEVTTYLEIADAIGRPAGARAVGRALGSNPVPFLIPCHRVIASDGSLGGYGFGVEMKQELLEAEGVVLPPRTMTT